MYIIEQSQEGSLYLQILPSSALPAAPADEFSRCRVPTSSAPAAAPSSANAPCTQTEPLLLLPIYICYGQQVPIKAMHAGSIGRVLHLPASCKHTLLPCLVLPIKPTDWQMCMRWGALICLSLSEKRLGTCREGCNHCKVLLCSSVMHCLHKAHHVMSSYQCWSHHSCVCI